MRQVWITRDGGPEVLEVKEAPDPTAGAEEVRIRVQAAGVNFADLMARQGLYPDTPPRPTVIGIEVAGVVDQSGKDSGFAEGDRVVAITRVGGYSDVVVVPRAYVLKLPDEVTFETAAAIPATYLTAWLMLVRLGNVQKGQRVLVHAVGGGVGQAALQICRWRGAEVIGTASATKHARLRELGVTECIDYHAQDFATEVARITGGRGVDIVLDAVGGRSYQKSYECLAPMGRLFLFGASSFSPTAHRKISAVLKGLWAMPSFKPVTLMDQNRGVVGFNLGKMWDQHETFMPALAEIVDLVKANTLVPVVDRTFPFAEASAAHTYIHEHKNFGKVLLVP